MFYLYRLLIFFICFEEMISRIVFPVKYCKYLLVFIVLIAVLHKNKWRFSFPIKTLFGKVFLLITVYSTIISVPFFVYYGWNGFDVPKKYLFFPILVICFYYAPLFGCSVKSLLFFYARTMLIYSVMNVVLYFLNLPIWNSDGYWGRISVGYPTVDVVSYAIAIAIFMFGNINKNWIGHAVASFVIALGIMSQVSGTGIVLLTMTFIFSVVFKISNKEGCVSRDLGKKILLLLTMMLVSVPVGYGILYSQRPDLLHKMEMQLENRVALLMQGKDYSLDVNTMDTRKEEFKIAKTYYLNDFESIAFGYGFGPLDYSYKMKNKILKKTVFLESQNHLIVFTSGVLGLIVFFLAVAETMKIIIRKKDRLLFVIGCFFIASFWTANPLMSFSLVGILSLCYVRAFCKEETEQKCFNDL